MSNIFKPLLLTFLFLGVVSMTFLTGCSSSPYRKVFVYGFGNMTVPKTDTIEDIDEKVRDRYGADLFWSPR